MKPCKEVTDRQVQELKKWYEEQGFDVPRNERTLRKFLIGCKYNVEKTRLKLKNASEFRRKVKQWYEKRDPEDPILADIISEGSSLLLPTTDENGAAIMFSRPMRLDPTKYSMDNYYKACFMCAELFVELDDNIVQNGVTIVVDLENFSLGYLSQLTPTILINTVRFFRDVYPCRLKGIHFFNCHFLVNAAIGLLRSFMPLKMKKRIYNYGYNMDALFAKINRSCLPNDYGGSCGQLSDLIQDLQEKLSQNRARFLSNNL